MNSGLVYLSLTVGILGTFLTIVMSTRILFTSWRKKAIEEAENTSAIRDNTKAVRELMDLYGKLDKRVYNLEKRDHAV